MRKLKKYIYTKSKEREFSNTLLTRKINFNFQREKKGDVYVLITTNRMERRFATELKCSVEYYYRGKLHFHVLFSQFFLFIYVFQLMTNISKQYIF